MAEFTAATLPTTRQEAPWQQRLVERVASLRRRFGDAGPSPAAAYQLEKDLRAALDEAGRLILEEEFNGLEPADKQQADAAVRYHRQRYRINKKTPAAVATAFGAIVLRSFLYLAADDGEPGLHPLHVRLGIVAGTATAVLAERAALWSVDHSQSAVRRLLRVEHGLEWSNDRLRRVVRAFQRSVVAFRAAAQEERLLEWLTRAERSRGRHRPVLAVGRDGIMVPLRGPAYQEAAAATVSVYDRRGRRLGTIYLGRMPEPHQAALSADLTALVTGVLARYTGPLPRLAYVTDKGQAQDDYYRRVLRRLRDPRRPGQRLHWEWVLDFFHVCSYVNKLREALFGAGGQAWLARMRHWLRDRPNGVSNILRSAMQHLKDRSLSRATQAALWDAYRYLRRHRRWMDYPRYRRQGLPIGSGVTEAACKTLFTQRLKRSGMRWGRESGQVIVELRALHLSGIWEEVVRRDLCSRRLPEVSHRPRPQRIVRFAA